MYPTKQTSTYHQKKTEIVDSGATHIYIAPNALYVKMDTTGKQIRVDTANGQVLNSTAIATLPIPQVNADFPTKGYIMPNFKNTLIGVGLIALWCLKKKMLQYYHQKGSLFSKGGKKINSHA